MYVMVLIKKKQTKTKNLTKNSPSRLLLEYYFFVMRWNISIVTMYIRIRVENMSQAFERVDDLQQSCSSR